MHKKKKSVWKKILWLIRPYLHFLMLSFVFAGISALLTLYAPILIGTAVDLIIGKGSVDFDAIGRIQAGRDYCYNKRCAVADESVQQPHYVSGS